MTTKRLTLTALVLGLGVATYGCSSDLVAPANTDGGDAKPSDAKASEGGDVPAPSPPDGGDAAGEAGGDAGVVLTPLQARGQYLVDHVVACGDCHTPRKMDGSPDFAKYLAGNATFVQRPNGDKLGSRNLTNDETGLKNRTDAEIKAMFMDGKRPVPTGTEALNPVMPYYVFHNMTSADGDAIVAYLRTVKGVTNEIPRRAASFDVPAPAPYLDPNKIPLPLEAFAQRESALRGRYLAAESGLCVECHTQHQTTGDPLNTAKLFQGGEDFSAFFATTLMIKPVSKNLTSDDATGLGTWTAMDIVTALKMGKAKDGSGICPPMPFGPMGAYGGLTDADALDIANYIKSLPPATNKIVDMCVFPPMMPTDGGAPEGGMSEGGTDGPKTEGGMSEGGTSEGGTGDAGNDAPAGDAASGN
jgi:mono/diheme cytochrome c family protein